MPCDCRRMPWRCHAVTAAISDPWRRSWGKAAAADSNDTVRDPTCPKLLFLFTVPLARKAMTLSRLAPEIRLHIWSLVLREPQIIELRVEKPVTESARQVAIASALTTFYLPRIPSLWIDCVPPAKPGWLYQLSRRHSPPTACIVPERLASLAAPRLPCSSSPQKLAWYRMSPFFCTNFSIHSARHTRPLRSRRWLPPSTPQIICAPLLMQWIPKRFS